MDNRFEYLVEKMTGAELRSDPFPHIYISDFLSDMDLKAVTTSDDVMLPEVSDLDGLFVALEQANYAPIRFPGCTESKEEYRKWLEEGKRPTGTHKDCEGMGMALRLQCPQNDDVRALDAFFRSPELSEELRTKFGITGRTRIEAGIQKYLNGYEISPHPDIRTKALTWMLNVNPAAGSESLDIHTRYVNFKPEWSFISTLWAHNPTVDTTWVPWDWCDVVSQQTENNSIVIFSPRWDTMHGVKARYDHLVTQRTQFYGNLWYSNADVTITAHPGSGDYERLVEGGLSGASLGEKVGARVDLAAKAAGKVKARFSS